VHPSTPHLRIILNPTPLRQNIRHQIPLSKNPLPKTINPTPNPKLLPQRIGHLSPRRQKRNPLPTARQDRLRRRPPWLDIMVWRQVRHMLRRSLTLLKALRLLMEGRGFELRARNNKPVLRTTRSSTPIERKDIRHRGSRLRENHRTRGRGGGVAASRSDRPPPVITRLFRRVLPVLLLALLLLCAAAAAWVYGEYREFTAPPTTRLSTDTQYQDAPASDRLHYLQHPLDHDDPAAGSFTGFYWLSPGFTPGDGVVFFLTDGQQPLVNQYGASDVLEQRLQGVSYVAIGRRGHAPTLFPEVYSASGALDHSLALDLYSSWQHVEDIERVRLDLLRLGYLPDSGQIMLMGGSGAGLLVQQYLSRYGHNVSRALLEVSGAPDLAAQNPALAAQSPALGTGHALDRLRLSHPTALDTLGQLLGDDSCHRCGHHDTDCSEGARGARRPSGGEDGGEGPGRARFGGEEPVFPPKE